jgi:hypothetical protein
VNGARGYRQGSTTVGADGSVSRSGSAAASGANGSVQSAGGFTRSANGTWSGSRSTSATNANTGNSYSGSTTIDPTTGKPVHTGTCTNSAGQRSPAIDPRHDLPRSGPAALPAQAPATPSLRWSLEP